MVRLTAGRGRMCSKTEEKHLTVMEGSQSRSQGMEKMRRKGRKELGDSGSWVCEQRVCANLSLPAVPRESSQAQVASKGTTLPGLTLS